MKLGLEKLVRNCKRFARSFILASVLAASAITFTGSYGTLPRKEIGLEQTVETSMENFEEMRTSWSVDSKFREYFKDYSIDGQEIKLNMPFGENDERSVEKVYEQKFYYAGKGAPNDLWKVIDRVVESKRFKGYASLLKKNGEKVVIFDLTTQKYGVYRDKELISKMKRGKYPGNNSLIYIYKKDGNFEKKDIYNYLYCIAGVGVDCSGFVYNVQKAIAAGKGIDLDKVLAEKLGVQKERLPVYIGTWFYTPENGYAERVEDRISNIKSGDIILFRGKEGKIKHSAVVESIDREKGVIRYVQNTDWAPQEERGVHESFITFNPENPDISLRDESLVWYQKVMPTFKGEQPISWKNDGDRYRAYQEYGGGIIVRLKRA